MDNKAETVLNGALDGIKKLVNVDTVIGDPIKVNDEITLIPISKVTCGFAGGGSGFGGNPQNEHFGGGAGGCVKVTPMCFLVVKGDNIRMLPVTDHETGLEKLVDIVPEMVDKITGIVRENKDTL
ncbi:MAG: sporulation protein YtfJ [Clostridia bacterium]|nr:sporulation protein YtfJ [Clostridia bacterium]